tara:strand:- start:4693 stop:5124 length:432 start_codon:yes stop_codon:yes gene_type:complete
MNLQTEETIDVGNVVFFIAAKSQTVIPGLVCEKIVRTSIDGSSKVNYVLEIRVKEGMKKVEVDPLKSELFPSAEKVEEHLVSSAVSHIKRIVQKAVEGTAAWGKEEVVSAVSQKEVNQTLDSATDEKGTIVDLGDGTVARLKM